MKKFIKRFWIFLPLILAAAMYFLLPHCPWFTEYVISRGLFKIVTIPVGFVTSLIPFSLTELLVVLAVPIIAFLVILLIVKLKKSTDKEKTAVRAARGVIAVISCACLMYMICHGANYYRYPLEKLMGYKMEEHSPEELRDVCVILAKGAAEARSELGISDSEQFSFSESIFTELSRTNSGYKALVKEYPFLFSSVLRQKPVILSEAWSYTGIVGMYFPFFVENNVNTAQPDYEIPYTAAHENAHSRGIALENECNFLAFLSCINSEYPEFRYSGYMEALKLCSNELLSADFDLWLETRQYLTEGMLMDFNMLNQYIDDHAGEVMDVSHEVNDTFITVQGVEDGAVSYDRATELILAYYCENRE